MRGGDGSAGGSESLGNLWLFSEVFSSRKPERTDEQATPAGSPGRAVRIRVCPGHDKNGENFWNWRLTCQGQFLQFARPAIVGSVPRCGSQGRWRGMDNTGGGLRFGNGAFPKRTRSPIRDVLAESKRVRHRGGSPTGDGVETIPLSSLFQCDRESSFRAGADLDGVAGRAWFSVLSKCVCD